MTRSHTGRVETVSSPEKSLMKTCGSDPVEDT